MSKGKRHRQPKRLGKWGYRPPCRPWKNFGFDLEQKGERLKGLEQRSTMTSPRFQRTALASEMRMEGDSRVYCCNPGEQ